MHRVIAGLNLWGLLLLLATLVLGLTGSRQHVPLAIFAVLFAMLAQCLIFALFMGASKLLKEHVERFALGGELVERTNTLMIPLFRWATAGALAPLLAGILGGLAISGDVHGWPHVAAGLLTIAVIAVATWTEVPRLRQMHDVLLAMEEALPQPAPGETSAPAVGATEGPDLRPRALVYVGSTVLVMVLGYRYISGLTIPATLFVPAVALSLFCLAAAAWLHWRRPRRAAS